METVGKVFLSSTSPSACRPPSPSATSSGLDLENVLILALWAFAGARIPSKRFRWEPQAGRS